jgi:hypothetical protein
MADDEHLDTRKAIRAHRKVRIGSVQRARGPEPSVMQSARSDVHQYVFRAPPERTVPLNP